jgi:hypothetical protein
MGKMVASYRKFRLGNWCNHQPEEVLWSQYSGNNIPVERTENCTSGGQKPNEEMGGEREQLKKVGRKN